MTGETEQLTVSQCAQKIAAAKAAIGLQRTENAKKRNTLQTLQATVRRLDAEARALFWRRERDAARRVTR